MLLCNDYWVLVSHGTNLGFSVAELGHLWLLEALCS